MNIKNTIITLGISVLLVACGQHNAQELPNGNLQVESTDEELLPIANPDQVRYDQSDGSRNKQADKLTIIDAAERVPGVTVESVELEKSTAYVTVTVDERLNINDRKEWAENIETAIRGAIHHYQIDLTLRQ